MTGVAMVLRHSLWVALVALLLFFPLTGLLLDGYRLTWRWELPLQLAGGVFCLTLLGGLVRPLIGYWRSGRGLSGLVSSSFAGEGSASVAFFLRAAHGSRFRSLVRVSGFVLLLLVAVSLPFLLGKYWLNVATLALIYVLLGLGLNIVVGLAGLLDLGFVAFYAVGAYGLALGHLHLGLGFWEALPLGGLLAACFGVLLGFPVLRMHGDYLAIVTLGFGEIIRLVLNNWTAFTGGPNGVSAPFPTFFGLEFSRRPQAGETAFHQFFDIPFGNVHRYIFLYLVLLSVSVFLIFVIGRLRRMPLGRAWEALREDEIACRSLGIDPVGVKLSAFAMGAAIGGVGGVFFAASQGFVNPTSFGFHESALVLAIVVLGGLGSTVGTVLAALVVTILPEFLRDFADYRILVFGLAMVGMMIWRPRGLIRPRRPLYPSGEGG
ncbi:MAG: high-affinity branched-chain amino acid ABC transporter permease LivM [Magnetococcales bacterium]|nr:high-affinity branched-chain amino acid ABC transporter permease LivM [Magnetococcales bacterium]MBF0156232.1 high-affinity branched-chain amino acid ABC transporter permease LivM [Magnetococcales bacterium]